jgi:hypothetical protein
MISLWVFVDLTEQILNPSVGFPQLSGTTVGYRNPFQSCSNQSSTVLSNTGESLQLDQQTA